MAAAAAAALSPTRIIHGRSSSVSLFAFHSRRTTQFTASLSTYVDRRIHSLSAQPVSRLLLKKVISALFSFKILFSCYFAPLARQFKIRRAEIIPQEQLEEVEGAFTLSRRVLLCALLLVPFFITCGTSFAAVDDSIRASGFGLKVATALRKSGWADEAIVFFLATLPVIELRGAIPVGYWMRLDPLILTIVSVLGNMVPVPFIVLYLKKFAAFLSKKSESATRFMDILFDRAREKAGPVVEFQWLGLMLFVAVPFPGTGAWTGAIIAAILDMPFWSAISANFFGVVLAGLLVNLLVNLGLKYAVIVGILLFFVSTVMWSFLRSFKSTLASK